MQPSEVVRTTLDALLTDDANDVCPGEQASQIAALLLQNPNPRVCAVGHGRL
jgi:hypothetical protein